MGKDAACDERTLYNFQCQLILIVGSSIRLGLTLKMQVWPLSLPTYLVPMPGRLRQPHTNTP